MGDVSLVECGGDKFDTVATWDLKQISNVRLRLARTILVTTTKRFELQAYGAHAFAALDSERLDSGIGQFGVSIRVEAVELESRSLVWSFLTSPSRFHETLLRTRFRLKAPLHGSRPILYLEVPGESAHYAIRFESGLSLVSISGIVFGGLIRSRPPRHQTTTKPPFFGCSWCGYSTPEVHFRRGDRSADRNVCSGQNNASLSDGVAVDQEELCATSSEDMASSRLAMYLTRRKLRYRRDMSTIWALSMSPYRSGFPLIYPTR